MNFTEANPSTVPAWRDDERIGDPGYTATTFVVERGAAEMPNPPDHELAAVDEDEDADAEEEDEDDDDADDFEDGDDEDVEEGDEDEEEDGETEEEL